MKKGTMEWIQGSIKIRKYKEIDGVVLYEKMGCNQEMMKYTGWNPYYSLEASQAFVSRVIANYELGEDYSWMIEVDSCPVGMIGAYDYNEKENSIEIGYSIFQDYWQKGYASLVVQMVCEYLMEEEGITLLKAWSAEENLASKRILEKCGFVETEIKEANINVAGVVYNQVFFEKGK